MDQGEQHCKSVTEMVMRRCVYLEDGYGSAAAGRVFDARFLDYRIDIDRLLRTLPPQDRALLELVFVDGLDPAEAVSKAGCSTEDPDAYVSAVAVKFGRLVEHAHLSDLLAYIG